MHLKVAAAHASGFHWTQADTAFTAAGAAVVVAVITLVTSLLTTRRTLATQRRLNEDSLTTQRQINGATLIEERRRAATDRLWAQRSSIYLAVMKSRSEFDERDNVISLASSGMEKIADSNYLRQRLETIKAYAAVMTEQGNGVLLFGGSEVTHLWRMYRTTMVALWMRAISYSDLQQWGPQDIPSVMAELRPLVVDSYKAYRRLEDAMRAESILDGEPGETQESREIADMIRREAAGTWPPESVD
jgi:hypothetical protein